MKKYISVDLIPYELTSNEHKTANSYIAYKSDIDNLPAANVAPVETSKWVGNGFTCEKCLRDLNEILDADSYFSLGFNGTPFCPWCGCKMN